MTHRQRIQAILDGEDPVVGRSVALAIYALVVLSLASMTLETVKGLPPTLYTALRITEWAVALTFLVEYVLRVYAAERRLRYITSFYGIVDLVSFLPTLLLLGYDARSIRIVRALRVLRILKLTRYVAAFERLAHAFGTIRSELIVFAGLSLVVLYICAAVLYHVEHAAQPDVFTSIPQAMWWAVVTLTTVGYGDVYPITPLGKLLTGIVLVVALGVIAVPTGLISSALAEERYKTGRIRTVGGDGGAGGGREGAGSAGGANPDASASPDPPADDATNRKASGD